MPTEYKYEEETFGPDPILIKDAFIAGEEIIELSPFKKWLCKLFKIDPVKSYRCTGTIQTEKESPLTQGDVIQLPAGDKFHITENPYINCFTIEGLWPFKSMPLLKKGDSVVISARPMKEGV